MGPKTHTVRFTCVVVYQETPKGRKGRVVVDIRMLNSITVPDNYPLPLQEDIVNLVAGYPYISTVDATSFFHKWAVNPNDHS